MQLMGKLSGLSANINLGTEFNFDFAGGQLQMFYREFDWTSLVTGTIHGLLSSAEVTETSKSVIYCQKGTERVIYNSSRK